MLCDIKNNTIIRQSKFELKYSAICATAPPIITVQRQIFDKGLLC